VTYIFSNTSCFEPYVCRYGKVVPAFMVCFLNIYRDQLVAMT